MAAANTDKFVKVGDPGTATTLASPGHTIGGTTHNVGSTANWPTDTGAIYAIDQVETVNGVETRVAGTYTEWEGVVASSTQITNATLRYGTDQNYQAGSTTRVYIPVASARENRFTDGILEEHNQDGTHSDVTATTLSVSGVATITGALTIKSYDGWITTADTWTYASSSTFTISGVDRTSQFPVGTKIKLTQTTAKYFYVTASSFSTNTTITVTGGSDYTIANATITSPAYSYDATPQGFPDYFNYSPSWTASGSNPSLGNGTLSGRFKINGKTCHLKISLTMGSTTTYGTGNYFLSLPVTASTSALTVLRNVVATGYMIDDSSAAELPAFGRIHTSTTLGVTRNVVSGANTLLNATTDSSPIAWATNDIISMNAVYEIA